MYKSVSRRRHLENAVLKPDIALNGTSSAIYCLVYAGCSSIECSQKSCNAIMQRKLAVYPTENAEAKAGGIAPWLNR
jgi:hypothetical protein